MRDYAGENYMRDNVYQWMNDEQFECYKMLCDIFGGSHHVYNKVYSASDCGIYTDIESSYLATYDFNLLTTAVFLAHNRAIRFNISPCPTRLKIRLFFHKREREGNISKRHPTLEEAIQVFNKGFKEDEDVK